MGKKLFPKMSQNLHILMWLTAPENFIQDVHMHADVRIHTHTHTHTHTHKRTRACSRPRASVLLEKLTGLQLVEKFPAFHGTRRFITALTTVRHLSLSWDSPIQSKYPHPTFQKSILISTHLRLGLASGLLPSGFPTKTLYIPLSSPIRTTCPAHLILLDFITCTILGEEYKFPAFHGT